MAKYNISKEEALELITPVVDNEVDDEVRIAFFEYIENDEDVRCKYESIKRLKNLVSSRCPCAKAPLHLKENIQNIVNNTLSQNPILSQSGEPIYDIPSRFPDYTTSHAETAPQNSFRPKYWKYMTAAAVTLIAVFSWFFLYSNNTASPYNVEEYAYAHFIKHSGKMVQPTIASASVPDAEVELSESFGMAVTIPSLRNAEFKGIVYTEFVPEFKSPMLEYYLPAEDQFIYIFAFNITKLNQFKDLVRSEEAVKSCIQSKDFHIRNINGKHVVSWKWSDTWYTAVSNHDGKTLASMIELLEYELVSDD